MNAEIAETAENSPELRVLGDLYLKYRRRSDPVTRSYDAHLTRIDDYNPNLKR